jgi:hypothetical protein
LQVDTFLRGDGRQSFTALQFGRKVSRSHS